VSGVVNSKDSDSESFVSCCQRLQLLAKCVCPSVHRDFMVATTQTDDSQLQWIHIDTKDTFHRHSLLPYGYSYKAFCARPG